MTIENKTAGYQISAGHYKKRSYISALSRIFNKLYPIARLAYVSQLEMPKQ